MYVPGLGKALDVLMADNLDCFGWLLLCFAP